MQKVFGEVYEVDQKLLEHLDWLESHPALYTRTPTQCVMLDTQVIEDCDVYMVMNFKPHLLSLPHLSSYDDSLDKSCRYRSKGERDEDYLMASEIKEQPHDS